MKFESRFCPSSSYEPPNLAFSTGLLQSRVAPLFGLCPTVFVGRPFLVGSGVQIKGNEDTNADKNKMLDGSIGKGREEEEELEGPLGNTNFVVPLSLIPACASLPEFFPLLSRFDIAI